jgi:hypothetical protein
LSTSDTGDSAKTCFVAMPITTPDAYAEKLGDPEHFAHILTHLFTPALQAAGLTVIPPSVGGSEIIHAEIIRNLEQADFVLCDMSDLNPNVFFELGIRTSLDRPVILVRDDLTGHIPFDLNAIGTATYDSSLKPWSLDAEIPRLASFIQDVIGKSNLDNAMWRYFGLTKRGSPSEAGSNPIEAKLDLVISELAKRDQSSNRLLSPPTHELSGPDMQIISTLLQPIFQRHGIRDFGLSRVSTEGEEGRSLLISLPKGLNPATSVKRDVVNELRNRGLSDLRVVWGNFDQ